MGGVSLGTYDACVRPWVEALKANLQPFGAFCDTAVISIITDFLSQSV